VDLCEFGERMSQKYERLILFDSQTEFSVSQIENYIFTKTHIFVKTNTQVTNRKFVFVDSKTCVQLQAY